ncbi:TPR-like protein [Fomitiporia mediterranea MF3/22]|uniref:TPR-like protein n=1 Tax=Fomitiporia mediterranea (strain MF3/22) TaxID=694068 RepID=UPI0004408793|nr:TPR-like protein [Fomitiporia mediterranea MF3/22]EJD03358.1 TPR-like protein [Fomitiporia mediterranea MF3/22]
MGKLVGLFKDLLCEKHCGENSDEFPLPHSTSQPGYLRGWKQVLLRRFFNILLRIMCLDGSRIFHHMALVYWTRFKQSGEREKLDSSINYDRVALDLRPKGHPYRSDALCNLAISLRVRYKQWGQTEDLEEAINLERAALVLRPVGHADRPTSLNNLAVSLHTRFDENGRTEDLEEAINLNRAALELRPEGHPGRFMSLGNLASSLHTRFSQCGRNEDLEDAVRLFRGAIELCPESHPGRSTTLSMLAYSLHTRFSQHGAISDLEESVELERAALELRIKGHSDRSMSLNNLSVFLDTRFSQFRRLEDLEEAIELKRAALELLPEGHPLTSMCLNNLADSLHSQYQQRGAIKDLEEAIELNRTALKLRPAGHPDRFMSLGNLAYSLHTRFSQFGKTEDLEEAIVLERATVDLCPEGHLHRCTSLSNLAAFLQTRFMHNGRTEDLNEAVELHRATLELRPKGHPDRFMSLDNLAHSLHTRFFQYERVEDLHEVIELERAALEVCPKDHILRSLSLNNIADSLHTRYLQHRKTEDLEEAIELNRSAFELYPEDHSDRSLSLSNLANTLRTRFEEKGEVGDIEETVRLDRAALELRPEGHTLRSASLENLANSLYAKTKRQWRTEDFEEWLARTHDHGTGFAAYKAIMSLLQLALTMNPTLRGQHDLLLRISDYRMLALEAASYAIEKDNLENTVEILEQGRGLLWAQLRGFRTPLDRLAETNEELVDRFRRVSRQLENLATSHEASTFGSTMSRRGSLAPDMQTVLKSFDEQLKLKRQLSDEQEGIIGKIRRVPGFESFLATTPFEELKRAASEGPVIIVNHSKYRSDALIIHSSDNPTVTCIPIDEKFYEESIALCDELVETRRRLSPDSLEYDEKLREAMKTLWYRVASKVVVKLKELGIAEGSRIWWCPTSMLSVLPFHAAGPFEDGVALRYLCDYYVSSYTPTLGALINARIGGHEDEPTVLVIGDVSLRSAKQEISNIRNCGVSTKLLVNKTVSREAVIRALQETTWVHFVCHGHLDAVPFNSSFNLSGGELTLLDIVQANLPTAEFAFLSACHTAEQPHDDAHDEVLHLAAAMQFSGFRSVIGSMWELLDEDGPAFARTVYEYMNDCEEGEVKYKRAAEGLRKAALNLKSRNGIRAERWVNLVHIGA